MKLAITAIALAVLVGCAPTVPAAVVSSPAPTTCVSTNGLPDPVCTPGAIDPSVTQDNIHTTICVAGYTAKVRPPSSYTEPLKLQQMRQYGLTGSPANYEEDHLISLELGGSPRDPANLWPEPGVPNAKDQVENRAHVAVCNGTMLLAHAQQSIASDWRALGRELGLVEP